MMKEDLKIFFEFCPCPIIAITGTKGKSTTASLIREMLKLSGKNVYLSGLNGECDFEFLDRLKPQSVVVLELSSSQLQDMQKPPHIAVMLGIAGEHLDDGDLPAGRQGLERVDAMRNMLRFQGGSDFAILNRDYPATNESDIFTEGKVFYVSREREVDEGCFVRDGKVVLRGVVGDEERIVIDAKKILLKGKDNLENVCAAVMASVLAGASMKGIRKVLVSFRLD